MRAFGSFLLLLSVLVLSACSDLSSAPSQRSGKIAVLLPLSGSAASFGGEMRDAVTLAISERGSGLEVQFFDTGGTEDGARTAGVAARSFGAELVLGPLIGRNIAAVRQGLGNGPAIISFSNDIRRAGRNNFIFSVTPAHATTRILQFAAQNQQTNLGLLYPDNIQGQAALDATERAARPLGLTVVAALPYSVDAGREGATSRQETAQQLGDLREEIDALFLPDSGGRLREVASLAFFYQLNPDAEAYLGTHLIDDPALATEPALNGAHFAAIGGSLEPFRTRFANQFETSPRLFSVAAYDAMSLASSLVLSGQGLSPATLMNPSGFTGVLGTYRLRQDGTTERLLAIKRLGPQGIEVVEPAATSFLF